MLTAFRKLKEKGIVGLNKRNADVMLPHNPRRLYPLVDDKIKTKKLADAAGLGVPALYGVIEFSAQVRRLAKIVEPYEQFVIKPANGAGGDGIVVIKNRIGDLYQKSNGGLLSEYDLRFHIQNALGGVFSLGGQPDHVLIEYCVQFDPVFEKVAYEGVPDVRVIVFMGFPIMAMVRLPTRMSGGRANLHQGALGAGIDIASGATLSAVWRNNIIHEHPDTRAPVNGVAIPGWQRILEIAAQTHDLTGLGYLGVDIVLDRDRGPLILELNARPGLNIQIANRAGLQPRLDAVQRTSNSTLSIADRVDFARQQFGVRSQFSNQSVGVPQSICLQ
jgi:alpha-L-glutamate ligase-like protein